MIRRAIGKETSSSSSLSNNNSKGGGGDLSFWDSKQCHRTNFDDYYDEDAGFEIPKELTRVRQVVDERKRQKDLLRQLPPRIEVLDEYKSSSEADPVYRRFPSFKQQLRRFVDGDVRERPLESDYLYAP